MKLIENLLLKACGYTLIILTSFYLFGILTDYTDPYISFSTFGVIFIFGAIISIANLILKRDNIHIALRITIHYLALLAAFFAVFIIAGNIGTNGAGEIFSSIVIFSVFYAIMFAVVYIVRRFIKKIDKRIDFKCAKKRSNNPPKSAYESLYKGDK